MLRSPRPQGFTIVELLIVIIVIGILATIGIMGWQNVRQRAYDAKVDVTLDAVAKGIKLYRAKHGPIPPLTFNIQKDYKYLLFDDPEIVHLQGFNFPDTTVTTQGSLGNVLANESFLPRNIESNLRADNWSDLRKVSGKVRYIRCIGFNAHTLEYTHDYILVWARAYSGINKEEIVRMRDSSPDGCKANINEKSFWAYTNGHNPIPGGWGWSSGFGPGEPFYKYRKVNIK